MNHKNPDERIIEWLALENELEVSGTPIEPPSAESDESEKVYIPTQTYNVFEKSYSKQAVSEDLPLEKSLWPKERMPIDLQKHFLAWYQPMHFYGENWGIYVLHTGLNEIMQNLASYCSQIEMNTNPKFKSEIRFAAWQLLFLHEEFHHKLEMFALRSARLSGKHSYRLYNQNVYLATKNLSPSSCQEEAICDAYVFRNIGNKLSKKVSKEIRSASTLAWHDYMIRATGPYAGSLKLVNKNSFENAVNKLFDQIITGTILPKSSSLEWGLFPEFLNSLPHLKANTFLVDDLSSTANLGNLLHLALPKRKLEKVITMYGYSKSNEGDGSHEKWKKAGSPFILLTKNREQSLAVIKSTARTLGMKVDDLARETRNL